ncbi:unnamed protein product [Ixodes pacificus]
MRAISPCAACRSGASLQPIRRKVAERVERSRVVLRAAFFGGVRSVVTRNVSVSLSTFPRGSEGVSRLFCFDCWVGSLAALAFVPLVMTDSPEHTAVMTSLQSISGGLIKHSDSEISDEDISLAAARVTTRQPFSAKCLSSRSPCQQRSPRYCITS